MTKPAIVLEAQQARVARLHPDDARAQLHADFTEIVRAEIGMNEQFASDMASAILRGLCSRLGGREVYIPAEDKAARNAAIRAEFDGTNSDAVCRRHGISRSRLYQIVGSK
jgi:Mor family transcriptional regulator